MPDSVRLAVYWYWMSDNISVRGVEEDLLSMEVPYGKVRMFSDEWWEVLHAALKKASELDIEIGIFNSPGWSQSGGPWIKPCEYISGTLESRNRRDKTITGILSERRRDRSPFAI